MIIISTRSKYFKICAKKISDNRYLKTEGILGPN